MESLTFDFSGIALRVDGLPDRWADRLDEEWRRFAAAPPQPPFLRLSVAVVDGEVDEGPFEPHLMKSRLARSRARFEMREGEAEIDDDGEGRIRLIAHPGLREYYVFMNLLRACLAWRLPSRGAAMIHSAGLVLDGRAFLLVGSEGSGKSSWAALGAQAGGRVVSDDLVLVEQAGDAFEVLASPLRSTHEAIEGPGRWPLAALLFPRHGSPALRTDCAGLLARARVTANLPFVSDGLENDARIGTVVDALVGKVRCEELTFALDGSFVDLLRAG